MCANDREPVNNPHAPTTFRRKLSGEKFLIEFREHFHCGCVRLKLYRRFMFVGYHLPFSGLPTRFSTHSAANSFTTVTTIGSTAA